MKQWTIIEQSTDLKAQDSYVITDLFKSEILDTRIVVSNLFVESRNNKNSEIFKTKTSKVKIQKEFKVSTQQHLQEIGGSVVK